jgi:hypothetical protein
VGHRGRASPVARCGRAGIYDYIKSVSNDSVLIGFANGPRGIYKGQYYVMTDEVLMYCMIH